MNLMKFRNRFYGNYYEPDNIGPSPDGPKTKPWIDVANATLEEAKVYVERLEEWENYIKAVDAHKVRMDTVEKEAHARFDEDVEELFKGIIREEQAKRLVRFFDRFEYMSEKLEAIENIHDCLI